MQLELQISQLKIVLGDKIVLNLLVYVAFSKEKEVNVAYWYGKKCLDHVRVAILNQ